MSAQESLGRQSALQIHTITLTQFFEVRACDCLFEKIEGKTIAPPRGRCEAATVHGNAVAVPRFFRDSRRGNLQLRALVACWYRNNLANLFNQAGEHDDPLLKSELTMKRACLTSERLAGNAGCHLRVATSKFASL